MKARHLYLFCALAATILGTRMNAQDAALYQGNRAPLAPVPYIELPVGAIKAEGWLKEMLLRQAEGATGHMDELYPQVMGERNGWLGGDGDQWERGPYWIDGLLPLAYILDDGNLKKKVQPWIEWTLSSQQESGYFGPAKDFPYEYGLQRDNSADWWPRMVVLKILQQYYSATQDDRVIDFMTRYFQYQLKTLPEKPLGHWTFWARYRVADNLMAVYWLYNITGDRFLLDLADLLHSQGFDFTSYFTVDEGLKHLGSIHCVNLAQGLKEPVIYYQQHPDKKYLDAVNQGLKDMRLLHGQPQGMFGGDENLHGSSPVQGSELCSAVELMFSLEKMLGITGDIRYADHLERIAFNALPSQISDDFMYKQYFQQPNQIAAVRAHRNFYVNDEHSGTDVVFGSLSGYPCCYSNMHQGWPKFTCHLWYATPDKGVAAMVYAPSTVTVEVGSGREVTITEETSYPMDGVLSFTVNMKGKKPERFPFRLRIPQWCQSPSVSLNGKAIETGTEDGTVLIEREWQDGDILRLELPMKTSTSHWHENSVAVERGPLVYALPLYGEWEWKEFPEEEQDWFGEGYYEIRSDDTWNYGIPEKAVWDPGQECKVAVDSAKLGKSWFWNEECAPVSISIPAKQLPMWTKYGEDAGPLPYSPIYTPTSEERITLIPYGCTTLRISEFPVTR